MDRVIQSLNNWVLIYTVETQTGINESQEAIDDLRKVPTQNNNNTATDMNTLLHYIGCEQYDK